ncbi:MAG: hypothetical protein LBP92_05225 [Deltaproteobacteria bacterium]|jgi:hypothetical protein|nr:hypothetical protein [Deltaproteobacteria bacterium]
MNQAIQFEGNIENGVIRIPEQYVNALPVSVFVTLVPVSEPRIIHGPRSNPGEISPNDFSALKIDTQGWKFDREEANERR